MTLVTRVSGNAIITKVMNLMEQVISENDNRQIRQTDLERMKSLLEEVISTVFPYEVDVTNLFEDQQEIVKTWLQLLQNSLTEAKSLLSTKRSGPRQSCFDCLVCNHRRLSNDVRDWSAFFDQLYHGFQSDLSMLLTSLRFASSRPLHIEEAASELVGSEIIHAEAKVEGWLKEDDPVHLIGVYGMPGVGKSSLLKTLYNKYKYQLRNEFVAVIWVTVSPDLNIFDLQNRIRNELPDLWNMPKSDEGKMELTTHLKARKFLLVLDNLWSRLDLQELGVEFGDGKGSKVLFSTQREHQVREMGAERLIEIRRLSKDEGWILFRRVAFKDGQVSMDIQDQDRARRFADECNGLPLAINIVAAMVGQTSVDKWDALFSSKKIEDPSFPATHPGGLDEELYTLLRWSYDALPSNVKNCFLYCAMYEKDEEIDGRQLVEMWIGEGLAKSKQGTHVMDMAVGRSYLKLLLDRCFFQSVRDITSVFRGDNKHVHDVIPSVRVHHHIRDMAVYIGQKVGSCLFMASQNVRNFPEIQDEKCRRISVANNSIEDLLRFPKLVCLSLEGSNLDFQTQISSLTSLRVLNLSSCTKITSVPTSVSQLRLLEFLSLRRVPIKALPDEICHLSSLQFLDLSRCEFLESLPTEIGELKNLKHLNLDGCDSLKMIPHEISELTSLSRLQLYTDLSVETEAPASIWSLKGLKNLRELQVWIDRRQDDMKSEIKDGIMGTWLEMRHLQLVYNTDSDKIMEDLPRDMQTLKKLQSFILWKYKGLSLPNYKFENLEKVELLGCNNIRELCGLEWLPNLKLLKLKWCTGVKELGIGSRGRNLMLEKLVLKRMSALKILGRASNTGPWDETTLPQLSVLKICRCDKLKRFPNGMEKLPKLSALMVYPEGSIMCGGGGEKLRNILKRYIPRRPHMYEIQTSFEEEPSSDTEPVIQTSTSDESSSDDEGFLRTFGAWKQISTEEKVDELMTSEYEPNLEAVDNLRRKEALDVEALDEPVVMGGEIAEEKPF